MKQILLLVFLAGSAAGQILNNGALTVVGPVNQCGTETGSANTFACANTKPIKAYRAGVEWHILATHGNTGAATLNIDGVGAAAITKNGTTALAGGEITTGLLFTVIYDGTRWQLQGTSSTTGGSSSGTAGGDLTGTYPNPTLAAVTTGGTFGSATTTPILTVDTKGRITAVTTTPTTTNPTGAAGGGLAGSYPNPQLAAVNAGGTTVGSGSQVPVITFNSAGQITSASTAAVSATLTGTAGGALTGSYPNPQIATVLTSPGTVGDATHIPVLTLNGAGQVTNATSVVASGGGGGGTAVVGEYSVLTYGAVADAVSRATGSISAGSTNFTDPNGTWVSGDSGKRIQVLGAGPGGTSVANCSLPSGSATLTCSGASYAASDYGKNIVVPGAGPGGVALSTTVAGFTSATVITLGATNASGATVSGGTAYLGYNTLDATISGVGSATSITLSVAASGTVVNALYWYGSNNVSSFQSALDTAGAAGGGIVRIPWPTTCPAKATCGYGFYNTDQSTAHNPAALKIRWSNVSLRGPEGLQVPLFFRGSWATYSNTTAQGAGPATIRGNGINIGDQDGTPGTAGLVLQNVTVANLRMMGMTQGNTYNTAFSPTSGSLLTTGAGWDETNKGIFIAGSDKTNNILIENVRAENFFGETIYSGGGLGKLVIRNCHLVNSNADGISVSSRLLEVRDNYIANHAANGIENGSQSLATGGGATTFNTVRHLYVGNHFENLPTQAIALVGVDSGVNNGVFQIVNNLFNNIAVVHPSGAQTAIDVVAQQGDSPADVPPSNVIVQGNVCHDCQNFFTGSLSANLEFKNNTDIVDNYAVNSVFLLSNPLTEADISTNHAYQTAAALTAGRSFGSIYDLNPFYASANYNWQRVFSHDNYWSAVTPWFRYGVTSGGGTSLITGKYISFARDVCRGCSVADADHGRQDITGSTHTILPIGPVVGISATTTGVVATIDASRSEQGAELLVQNVGTNAIGFQNDGNVALQFTTNSGSGSLAAGASARFRFDSFSGKWIQN